ncbi:MAG: efflux RND transporter periplasmic adaptor subunit [Pirellulaceae bacterium]
MKRPVRNSRGFAKTTIVVGFLVVGGIVAGTTFLGGDRSGKLRENELTFAAFRADFISSITESGDVASSSNKEIRCRVRERGGTTILDIVDEGTMVEEGDFLAQLDDSGFRDELIEQKIRVATDRADVIQSESDLQTAERTLIEFQNGQFAQELATIEADEAFAKENLYRAQQYLQYSENLARKGYVTKAQLEADQFAVIKAQRELDLMSSQLVLFREFTQDRMEAELQAEIQKQQANLEASQFTLELSKQRLAYYEGQVAACRILAPSAGQVVYANEVEGRGESGIVIEEGVTVREGQSIINLPDPENMQVTTRVNDSKINAVQAGQEAIIRLDTAPETPIRGVVSKVADFPEPRRWSQAPIEYEVHVAIQERSDLIRPGLRAKVEVFVERVDNCIQVPVSSLVERSNNWFVVVKRGKQHELRPVTIGSHNESTVIILDGLEVDEHVLVDPDEFHEQDEQSAEDSSDT